MSWPVNMATRTLVDGMLENGSTSGVGWWWWRKDVRQMSVKVCRFQSIH
jgi:hypothetical protein